MDFKFRKVRDIQDVFVAGKKFEYLAERQLSYKDLETLPVMCLEGNTSTRAYVEGFLRENGVHLQPEFELATSDMLIRFAMRGFGIAGVAEDFALEAMEKARFSDCILTERFPKDIFVSSRTKRFQ